MNQGIWDIPEIIYRIKRLFDRTGRYDTVWNDLYPLAISTKTTGSNVPGFTAYSGNLLAYEFPGVTTLKEIQTMYQLPHNYKEGTTIKPHLHLRIPNDGSGGIIKFGCEYEWTNIDGTSVSTTTVYGTLTVGASAGVLANKVLVLPEIAGTGKTISSIFNCRIFRDPADAGDTFGSSVWLKSADIHYEQDKTGSDLELTKDA